MCWENARKYCRSMGCDLASLTDPWEMATINKFVPHITPVWLGAQNCDKHQWNFEWLNGCKLSCTDPRWGSSWWDDVTCTYHMNEKLPYTHFLPNEKYLAYQKGLSPFVHWWGAKEFWFLCKSYS